MTAATKLEPLDWRVYLEGEELAEQRHEYVCGRVYAMAGAKRQHNRIVGNVYHALRKRLDGSRCEPFTSELKVRTRTQDGVCFYYPDVLVECGPHDPDAVFTDDPVVVVEVLSPSTRRIDEHEKKTAYLSIPSLSAYVLIDAEQIGATVWRRAGAAFESEVYPDLAATIPLSEINAELPLTEVYANVVWTDPNETPLDE